MQPFLTLWQGIKQKQEEKKDVFESRLSGAKINLVCCLCKSPQNSSCCDHRTETVASGTVMQMANLQNANGWVKVLENPSTVSSCFIQTPFIQSWNSYSVFRTPFQCKQCYSAREIRFIQTFLQSLVGSGSSVTHLCSFHVLCHGVSSLQGYRKPVSSGLCS